jgi:hypothetical protein
VRSGPARALGGPLRVLTGPGRVVKAPVGGLVEPESVIGGPDCTSRGPPLVLHGPAGGRTGPVRAPAGPPSVARGLLRVLARARSRVGGPGSAHGAPPSTVGGPGFTRPRPERASGGPVQERPAHRGSRESKWHRSRKLAVHRRPEPERGAPADPLRHTISSPSNTDRDTCALLYSDPVVKPLTAFLLKRGVARQDLESLAGRQPPTEAGGWKKLAFQIARRLRVDDARKARPREKYDQGLCDYPDAYPILSPSGEPRHPVDAERQTRAIESLFEESKMRAVSAPHERTPSRSSRHRRGSGRDGRRLHGRRRRRPRSEGAGAPRGHCRVSHQ